MKQIALIALLGVNALSLGLGQQPSPAPATQEPAWVKWSPGNPAALGPTRIHTEGVRANLTVGGGVTTISMPADSARMWDVQVLAPIALSSYMGLPVRVRVEFSIRASRAHKGRVKLLEAVQPWPLLGLDQEIEIPTEWKRIQFDFKKDPDGRMQLPEDSHPGAFIEIQFAALRGQVEIRGLSIRAISPSFTVTAGAPPKTDADVFRWLDELPKAFVDKDFPRIRGAWTNDYREIHTYDKGDSSAMNLAESERYWGAQIVHGSQFTNGPGEVLVRTMTQKGDVLTVTGYWEGSWRVGTADSLSDWGASFFSTFTQTWVKAADGWRLKRLETRSAPKANVAEFRRTHEALKKRFR